MDSNTLTAKLSLVSYNSQGSGPGKFEYIAKLLDKHDFVLIQEHWLMESQFVLYNQNINNCNYHCVSAIESNKLLSGRPFGGCGILWKKNFVASVTPISTQSTQLCAVELVLNKVSFLLCNVYMPTTGCCNFNSEYKSVLHEIRSLLEDNNCFYALIGGDFNTDLNKTGSNVTSLNNFLAVNT